MAVKKRSGRLVRRLKKSGWGIFTVVAVLVLLVGWLSVLELSRPHVSGDRLRFDTFVELVDAGQVSNARILDEDSYVVGSYVRPDSTVAAPPPSGQSHGGLGSGSPREKPDAQSGSVRSYNAPLLKGMQVPVINFLVDSDVDVDVDQQVGKRVASLASVALPTLILVVLILYMIVSYRRGSGLFGIRSGARGAAAEGEPISFDDVAGQDAAVAELREIKEFLSDPERFTTMGAQVPKGILLYGPPGCGKTMLAKALASEAGASFYSISGSDFVELYVGVGASRVRDLFGEARENSPALIFIDELDSVGRARGATGAMSTHGEQEQALNQILAEMDGFSSAQGVIVVAATNRPDILDQALLRPGRFDRTIGLERPDEAARLAILKVHARDKRLAPDVDLAAVANRAIGLTGADLAGIMNEGTLLAVRAGKDVISAAELDSALEKLLGAPERQRRLSMRERSIGRRSAGEKRVTFADVAGVDDAIAELAEVRDYLADPDRFAAIGASAPKGILLSGPPGCGKTLLARAVAGEANAAFLSVAGSEFIEVFAGEGASRARELFAEAASIAPAIIFLDEIDAIGATRSSVSLDGHREREQTLNQILIELDGFEARTGILVMAATNRPDILDPALVRPGRFDRHVTIALPDRSGRRDILALHSKGKDLAPDVDLAEVAAMTRGFSGADLANVLNEAALLTARHGLDQVPINLIEEGIDRVSIGVASRGTLLSLEERTMIAYHEAGHALVAGVLGQDTPRKVSILPRGGALGRCTTIDVHDRVLLSRPMMIHQITVLLAGWAAERLVFGSAGSGVATDIHRAGVLARRMVRDYGMSEALGPLSYPPEGDIDGHGVRSEEVARVIDAEVRSLVDQAAEQALSVLAALRGQLDAVAQALIEHDTLSSDDLGRLMASTVVAESR